MNDHNGQLRSIIERAVKIEEDRKEMAADLRDVYAEARSNGFDPAALRVLVKEQLEDMTKRQKRQTKEEIIETYRAALGTLASLPLGQAALDRVSA